MKHFLLLFYLCLPLGSGGQVITTFAGNGGMGNTGDGELATAASIAAPDGCAFDVRGNIYFTTVGNDKLRKVTSDGIISTIAGTGAGGYNGDGIPATSAQINDAAGIAIDRLNNIYIADSYNNIVRKIDAISGIITSVAGTRVVGFGGDNGPATAAVFNGVEDVCVDKYNNLYISDYNNFRIRKVNTAGVITTFAGNGTNGYSGDGGMATNAELQGVKGICSDKLGNIYITQNYNIRKIDVFSRIVTIAGNGLIGPSGDGSPATQASLNPVRLVCDDYGNLYVSGYTNNDVRVIDKYGVIHTVGGTGVYGFAGDNGPATAAQLSSTFGIALDSCGNVYVADKDNYRIRKIAMNPYCLNLGTNNMVNNDVLSIYPNPAYENINIDNIKTQSEYILLNIIGSIVQEGTLKERSNSISVRAMASGVYFLEVMDNEREKRVFKIVKE